MNLGKFLRTPFLTEHLRWLLLHLLIYSRLRLLNTTPAILNQYKDTSLYLPFNFSLILVKIQACILVKLFFLRKTVNFCYRCFKATAKILSISCFSFFSVNIMCRKYSTICLSFRNKSHLMYLWEDWTPRRLPILFLQKLHYMHSHTICISYTFVILLPIL